MKKLGKRTKCRFITVAIILSAVTAPVFAAEGARTLTFQDALKLARANSPDYKIADITREDSILNSNIAKDWIPSLSLSSGLYTGGFQSFGYTTNPLTGASAKLPEFTWDTVPSQSLNLKLGLNFSLSAGKFFNIAKQSATKESADAIYNKTIQGYDTSIFSSYWGLKSYELAEQAAEASYNSAKSTYDSVVEKYNNGMASSLDKANAELSLSNAEASLLNARTNVQRQKIAFKTAIGYDGQMPFVLDDVPKAVVLDLPDAEKLYAEYINKSYDIRMYRASEDSIKANLESAKWTAYTPTISLNASYGINPKDKNFIASEYGDKFTLSVSAAMSLDGFIPGTTTHTQIKSLSNNAKIASLQRQKAEQNLLASIEDALGTLKANYEKLKSAEITLKTATESYNLTKESYDNGKSTMESLMNAEAMLLNARTGLISSNMMYMLSQHTLATTLGITLDELQAKYKSTDTNGINVESAVPSDGQSNNISNN